jgi:hypothetical protein
MRHCFRKAKKKNTTSNNRRIAKQRRIKNLNEQKEIHVPLKVSSSRLVNSFRNSTMLESTTERPFPVCICWRRKKKARLSLLIRFFVLGSENKEEKLRTKEERERMKKKTMKHRPDKSSFFNLFRSFSASNTSLDGIVDPQ